MNKLRSNIAEQSKTVFLFILLIFCGQFTVSCRKNPSGNQKHRFKTSIDLISYQVDTIQVFYKMNVDDRYTEKLSIKKNIKASSTLQNLVFELPYGIKPRNIRIDLGENKNENDSIRVENVRFQYKDRMINGDKGVYKSWFTFNENVIEGKNSLTFHLKRINNSFDPQLNGNRKLNAELVKLYPPDIYDTKPIIKTYSDLQKIKI